MLVKYYLSDNINAPFENFALGLKTLEMALIYIYINLIVTMGREN